jgi:cyclophilin family peptidyl-prolyl cis-trans isomerase
VRQGFYDGLTFHRIVAGFVIQGGDPLGNGQGGPGYSVVEAPPSTTRYTSGVVAMAKTAAERPGTSGSQFFVVTGDDVGLPPEYAVAGKVTSGMATVTKIGAIPAPDPQNAPEEPVVISKATLAER